MRDLSGRRQRDVNREARFVPVFAGYRPGFSSILLCNKYQDPSYQYLLNWFLRTEVPVGTDRQRWACFMFMSAIKFLFRNCTPVTWSRNVALHLHICNCNFFRSATSSPQFVKEMLLRYCIYNFESR